MTDTLKKSDVSKFGTIVTSIGIKDIPVEIWENLLINRHFKGDWGDLCPEDIETNNYAYKGDGHWILSVYKKAYKGKDIWIETHGYGIPKESADYNHTVVMFPEEH